MLLIAEFAIFDIEFIIFEFIVAVFEFIIEFERAPFPFAVLVALPGQPAKAQTAIHNPIAKEKNFIIVSCLLSKI